jgi:NAD+ synthase (glutamine-hydrolysing)
MRKDIKICVAQMDVIPANPSLNTKKMIEIIKDCKNEKVDLAIFPELCIPGYVVGDMWERLDFLEECQNCTKIIMNESDNIMIAFGNITFDSEYKNEDGRIRKYNSCLVVKNKNIISVTDKTLQPNYRLFDDNRHFYDSRKRLLDSCYDYNESVNLKSIFNGAYNPIDINGNKIGFLICEDSWDTDYTFSPISILAKKSDIIVNISCSPFTMGKNYKRDRLFSEHAKRHNVEIIYVNNVGLQNNGKTIYTFDGDSCIYRKDGVKVDLYEAFQEGARIFNLFNFMDKNEQLRRSSHGIEKLYNCLCYGVKKFLDQIKVEKIIIGASGGIDSAVVASIFHQVMENPEENLYLINMPTKFNSETTKKLAKDLSQKLKCKYYVFPIGDSVDLTRSQLEQKGFNVSDFCFENIQARDRSSRVLAAISSSVGGVFTCNANKSETTVGYSTLYGDLGGFMAPLADVWKTEVYSLAKYINDQFDLIPEEILNIKPSAELSDNQNIDLGRGDPLIYEYHDCLFKSWVERWNRSTPKDILKWVKMDVLEKELNFNHGKIIEKYFNNDIKLFIEDLEKWWNLFDGFAYAKRIQAPPILAVSRRSYGWDLRESQTIPFYSTEYYELKEDILS